MEFVTALRGTFDEQKPSLFELLSEQQLAALLPPTLRYLLTVATQRHPRYLLRLLNSFDELYAVCMLLIERHYLRTRGGSFTEHFYGLKREKALHAEIPRASRAAPGAVRDALGLGHADVWRNLAVLVGLPYLKRKLDEAHEVNAPRALLGAAYNRLPAGASPRERLVYCYRWFLRNVYPSVNAAYYFALLAFNLAYLFDASKYHNPFMWLVGTRVRRMNAADYHAVDTLAKAPARGLPPGPVSLLSPRNLGSRALSSLSVLLPTSIFALKFLEWWYASDFAKQLSRKAAESLDLPPPVVAGEEVARAADAPGGRQQGQQEQEQEQEQHEQQQQQLHAGTPSCTPSSSPPEEDAPVATPSLMPIYTVPAPGDSGLCPICGEDIVTPTACQTGVVYCYACIHRWIEGVHPRQEAFMGDKEGRWESGRGRCAVTGRRVLGSTEGLRRIMV